MASNPIGNLFSPFISLLKSFSIGPAIEQVKEFQQSDKCPALFRKMDADRFVKDTISIVTAKDKKRPALVEAYRKRYYPVVEEQLLLSIMEYEVKKNYKVELRLSLDGDIDMLTAMARLKEMADFPQVSQKLDQLAEQDNTSRFYEMLKVARTMVKRDAPDTYIGLAVKIVLIPLDGNGPVHELDTKGLEEVATWFMAETVLEEALSLPPVPAAQLAPPKTQNSQ